MKNWIRLALTLTLALPSISALAANEPKRLDCDSVLVGPLALIIREMESEGIISMLNSAEAGDKFANECGLACPLFAVEAISRMIDPKLAQQKIDNMAQADALLAFVKRATGRKIPGNNIYEYQGIAQFLARRLGIETLQTQTITEISKDTFPNLSGDLVLLGAQLIDAPELNHMILGYQFHQNRLLAVDPITGKSATYDVVFFAPGVIHLHNVTRTDGVGLHLSLKYAVKLWIMNSKFNTSKTETIRQLDLLQDRLATLLSVSKNPLPLIAPDKFGRQPGAAKLLVADLLEALKDTKLIHQLVDPTLQADPNEAAAYFALRLRFLEVVQSLDENQTIQWFMDHDLLDTPANLKPVKATGLSASRLDDYLSKEFKDKRTKAEQDAIALFDKKSLTKDDIFTNLRRVMDLYDGLLVEAAAIFPPRDAHQVLSTLYVVLKKVMDSNAAQIAFRDNDREFGDLVKKQWGLITNGRNKFDLR